MKQALVSIDDQIVSDDDKNKLFNQVNPYITQTLYRLYDAERAKKENEIENIKWEAEKSASFFLFNL